nr:hypothetical protein Iba_chr14bCG12780 [Ipomoea batatas]
MKREKARETGKNGCSFIMFPAAAELDAATAGESPGDPTGDIADPSPALLHLLTGGVLTLHESGSWSASVWLICTPTDEPPPLTMVQRHRG